MKGLLTLILILSFSSIAISKGSYGTYLLKGIAYQNKLTPLRNSIIELEFGDNKLKIKTNNKGQYFVKIKWEYPCLVDVYNKYEEQLIILRFNPRYLIFKYKQKCIYVENYFYDTSHIKFIYEDNQIFKHDLQF